MSAISPHRDPWDPGDSSSLQLIFTNANSTWKLINRDLPRSPMTKSIFCSVLPTACGWQFWALQPACIVGIERRVERLPQWLSPLRKVNEWMNEWMASSLAIGLGRAVCLWTLGNLLPDGLLRGCSSLHCSQKVHPAIKIVNWSQFALSRSLRSY